MGRFRLLCEQQTGHKIKSTDRSSLGNGSHGTIQLSFQTQRSPFRSLHTLAVWKKGNRSGENTLGFEPTTADWLGFKPTTTDWHVIAAPTELSGQLIQLTNPIAF